MRQREQNSRKKPHNGLIERKRHVAREDRRAVGCAASSRIPMDVSFTEQSRAVAPAHVSEAVTPRHTPVSWRQAICLPLGFVVGLLVIGMLNPVRQNPRLLWSFVATSLILATWSVAVIERARRTDRQLTLEIPVDFTAHRTRTNHVRRCLWSQHRPAVPVAEPRRCTGVL